MKLCVPAQRKPDDARLGERAHQAVAEERDLVGKRHLGERQVVGMDVDVPQPGQQVGAAQIDDCRAVRRRLPSAGQDFRDAPVLDDDARPLDRRRRTQSISVALVRMVRVTVG